MNPRRFRFGFLSGLVLAIAACAGIGGRPPVQPPTQPPPVVAPVNRALQPLHMGGPVAGSPASFVYPDGVEFRFKGITDFSLFWRYLNHEDIVPVLKDRVSVGANTVRVLGMVSWLDTFSPQERPDYFDRLRTFTDLLAANGLRVEFVVFADAQIKMPDQNEQLAHWNRVIVTLGDKNNVFLQVVNQGGKNGVDSGKFPCPSVTYPQWSQLIASRDSGFESANPPMPACEYSAYTTTRSDVKWYVESGSSMYYVIYGWGTPAWMGTNGAAIADETMGASETDQPGRRSNNVGFFKQLARSFIWGNGAVFHCDDCINSIILGPTQRSAAVEFEGNLP